MSWDDTKSDHTDKVLAADWNDMVTDQNSKIEAESTETLKNKTVSSADNTITIRGGTA